MLLAQNAYAQSRQIELDRNAHPAIRKIAALPIPESKSFVIRNVGSAGGAVADLFLLGLGSAVETNANNDNTKLFVKTVNERKMWLGPRMLAALRDEFRKNGLEFVYLPNQRARLTSDGKGLDYSGITTTADAILHVVYGETGYVSSRFSSQYQPKAVAVARLIDARTREVIYLRVFCAGCTSTTKDIENIAVDVKYSFDNFETLIAKVEEAVDGIRGEHRKVAARIAEHLRPLEADVPITPAATVAPESRSDGQAIPDGAPPLKE